MQKRLNADEYVSVNNIPVPKKLIEEMARQRSATLVTDKNTIALLEQSLDKFVKEKGRFMTQDEAIFLPGHVHYYIYVPLPVDLNLLMGLPIKTESEKFPIWFAVKRGF